MDTYLNSDISFTLSYIFPENCLINSDLIPAYSYLFNNLYHECTYDLSCHHFLFLCVRAFLFHSSARYLDIFLCFVVRFLNRVSFQNAPQTIHKISRKTTCVPSRKGNLNVMTAMRFSVLFSLTTVLFNARIHTSLQLCCQCFGPFAEC